MDFWAFQDCKIIGRLGMVVEREELRPLSDILNDAFDSEKNFKKKSG